ncbi:MAG TPA: hypothetical protein VLH10_14545, partial [Yinghuangia sp.]|nr:hypothetical protein [Yinghuangia sp.]
MRTVRAFIRRVPIGPVVIALLMVGVLTLVNFYGSQGGTEHAAPSEPVGIPPQLPAQERGSPTPSEPPATPPAQLAPTPAPAVATPEPGVRTTDPVPSTRAPTDAAPTTPRQDPPATVTMPPIAPAPANPPQSDGGSKPQGGDDGR